MSKSLVIYFLLLLPLWSCSQDRELTGKVVRIADGDTFTLLVEGDEQVRVRLHGIDAPERSQPYSRVATDFLGEQLKGDNLVVRVMDTDQYGRVVGMVIVDGRNVNEELIRAGYAWHFKRYDNNPVWERLENEAREAGRGLWQEKDPTPPWVYRRQN